MDENDIPADWRFQKRPVGLTRSFSFDEYDQTRQFLDDLAELSEKTEYYPNINFSRTQVNLSIESDSDELGSSELDFATATNELYAKQNN